MISYYLLFLLFVYMILIDPKLRNLSRSVFFKTYSDSPHAKYRMYQDDFSRNIFLGFLVLLFSWFSGVTPLDLGFKDITLRLFYTYPNWLKISLLVFFSWFVLYFFFFVTLGVRMHKKFRSYLVKKIKPVAMTAPSTKTEYLWWTLNSFAGSAEEIVYRGFIFFLFQTYIPSISLWIVALISIFLESIRYAPRIAAVRYVAIRSSVFAISVVVFNSIYPAIILHVVYNLRIMAVPFHWALKTEEEN